MGNSMPIRDLDMYAAPAAAGSSRTSSGSGNGGGALGQGVVATSLGAPVAANRGASGIDGVLSTGARAACTALPALLAGAAPCWAQLAPCPCCIACNCAPHPHPLGPLACLARSHLPACPAAAGFADGLARGTTLVVGDISFLHDINGLNLLRSGECRVQRAGRERPAGIEGLAKDKAAWRWHLSTAYLGFSART